MVGTGTTDSDRAQGLDWTIVLQYQRNHRPLEDEVHVCHADPKDP